MTEAGTVANDDAPTFDLPPGGAEALAVVGDAFARRLASMYANEPQATAGGSLAEIDDTTRIALDEGLVLYRSVVATGAPKTLEVGLAYGFSTLYMLAGLAANGGGVHMAIDPYQHIDWQGIGVTSAHRALRDAGQPKRGFSLIEERSEVALTDLQRSGEQFGVIFIDGYHRFDDVLVDFTLAAPLCPVGGVIVLHDMWLGSIAAVASFLRANRSDFIEIDIRCDNLFAVRRIGEDERNWDHFVPFATR